MKTLREMIEVMEAAERGETIQIRDLGQSDWYELTPHWNWSQCDYRVKPSLPKGLSLPLQIAALEKSIDHWRDDYPLHCDFERQKFEYGWQPTTDNCALCQLYAGGNPLLDGCGLCPLKPLGDDRGCERGSSWFRAYHAVLAGNRADFMSARAELLDIMADKLDELRNLTPGHDATPTPRPWREKKLRPWTFDEVPVGRLIVAKQTHARRLIVSVSDAAGIVLGGYTQVVTPEHVLATFLQLDGSPCGVEETS